MDVNGVYKPTNITGITNYHLVMTNSSPWKIHPFLSSVNHLFLWAIYTMAMLVITRGYKSPLSICFPCIRRKFRSQTSDNMDRWNNIHISSVSLSPTSCPHKGIFRLPCRRSTRCARPCPSSGLRIWWDGGVAETCPRSGEKPPVI